MQTIKVGNATFTFYDEPTSRLGRPLNAAAQLKTMAAIDKLTTGRKVRKRALPPPVVGTALPPATKRLGGVRNRLAVVQDRQVAAYEAAMQTGVWAPTEQELVAAARMTAIAA